MFRRKNDVNRVRVAFGNKPVITLKIEENKINISWWRKKSFLFCCGILGSFRGCSIKFNFVRKNKKTQSN